MMKSAIRSSFVTVAVVAVLGFNAAVASAQVVCGSNIITKAVMDVDLVCGASPGFTVGAGGSVDMAGHSVTMSIAAATAVSLSGAGAKLSNGAIVGGGGVGSVGVALSGGTHKVENVFVTGAETGFYSTSNTNKIKNCTALDATYGFRVSGADKNAFSRCHSDGSAEYNFWIVGNNNNLTENTSSDLDGGATGSGIYVGGLGNKLSRNNSTDDRGPLGAIYVGGNENKLSLNSVTGSNTNGLRITGNENKISKTVADDSANVGIVIVGDLNKLSKNAANDNGDEGITVDGDGNNINGSNTSDNGDSGIRILPGSDINSLKSNITMANGANGVLVETGATNSSISKTVALGNTDPDLQDDNANCDGNVWQKSVFGSSEAGGVGGHDCIQ